VQVRFKKGDLIRVKTVTPWQTSELGRDEPVLRDMGKFGLVLDLYHAPFNQAAGYETWKVRLIDGTLGVYASKDLILAAKS